MPPTSSNSPNVCHKVSPGHCWSFSSGNLGKPPPRRSSLKHTHINTIHSLGGWCVARCGPYIRLQDSIKMSSSVLPLFVNCRCRSCTHISWPTFICLFLRSYDVRGRSLTKALYWSDTTSFGPRAYFVTVSKPAALSVDNVQLDDEGVSYSYQGAASQSVGHYLCTIIKSLSRPLLRMIVDGDVDVL